MITDTTWAEIIRRGHAQQRSATTGFQRGLRSFRHLLHAVERHRRIGQHPKCGAIERLALTDVTRSARAAAESGVE
jgi:hypothetical protein